VFVSRRQGQQERRQPSNDFDDSTDERGSLNMRPTSPRLVLVLSIGG
jgi:hypothetical protein